MARLLFNRREFRLPSFDLTPLDFGISIDSDELLLEDVVTAVRSSGPDLRVVHSAPTAGELRESIERHLEVSKQAPPQIDAADELRNALAELRRSIG
ncbi:MAG TPA: hypothetical protein VFP53_05130 [Sphingomicrobium sp.]|nr:hypothetical protein [Sphingomicrobium sp.]